MLLSRTSSALSGHHTSPCDVPMSQQSLGPQTDLVPKHQLIQGVLLHASATRSQQFRHFRGDDTVHLEEHGTRVQQALGCSRCSDPDLHP